MNRFWCLLVILMTIPTSGESLAQEVFGEAIASTMYVRGGDSVGFGVDGSDCGIRAKALGINVGDQEHSVVHFSFVGSTGKKTRRLLYFAPEVQIIKITGVLKEKGIRILCSLNKGDTKNEFEFTFADAGHILIEQAGKTYKFEKNALTVSIVNDEIQFSEFEVEIETRMKSNNQLRADCKRFFENGNPVRIESKSKKN